MMRLKPVIEPAGPELRDENGRVWSEFLDPGKFNFNGEKFQQQDAVFRGSVYIDSDFDALITL